MMCQGFGADFTSKDMYGSDIIAPVCALAAFKIGVLLNTLLWHKTHAVANLYVRHHQASKMSIYLSTSRLGLEICK